MLPKFLEYWLFLGGSLFKLREAVAILYIYFAIFSVNSGDDDILLLYFSLYTDHPYFFYTSDQPGPPNST